MSMSLQKYLLELSVELIKNGYDKIYNGIEYTYELTPISIAVVYNDLVEIFKEANILKNT